MHLLPKIFLNFFTKISLTTHVNGCVYNFVFQFFVFRQNTKNVNVYDKHFHLNFLNLVDNPNIM